MLKRPRKQPILIDKPIKDDKLCDVYKQSLEGFAIRLRSLFPDRTIMVVDGSLDAAKKQLSKRGEQIKYPFFAIQFRGTDTNKEGYNVKALMRRGRRGAMQGDSLNPVSTSVYHLLPVTVNISVQFQTNDVKDVYDFTQRWLLAAEQNLFQMWLEAADTSDPNRKAPIHIRVELDSQLQIPELNADEKDADYTFEANAIMRTYIGTIRKAMNIVGYRISLDLVSIIGATHEDGKPVITDKTEISTNFIKNTQTVKTI